MKVDRRDFFRIASAGILSASSIDSLQARTRKSLPSNAVGILYDATLCIGCKACEVACKRNNNMPIEHSDVETQYVSTGMWDSPLDLSTKTLNKIKLYRSGSDAQARTNKEIFSYIKRACMHCVDPDCMSACPTSAFTKDPETGIVSWNKKACCGCRYCQIACPYNIPKFEFDVALPELLKCEMCAHVIKEGGIPGCCEFCPTGASLYGPVTDLLEEARNRITLNVGTSYDYPTKSLDSGNIQTKTVKKYVEYIYGEQEGGGTQYMILSSIPFKKLGLPTLPGYSGASVSENIQHTIYKGFIAPISLLVGLMFAAHRSNKKHNHDQDEIGRIL